MHIQSLHPAFIMPTKASDKAGAFDVYMPEAGTITGTSQMIGLGFAAAVPDGYVGLLLPRSSAGAKHGVELNNTCGVIDSDYRGEWKAAMRTKAGTYYSWEKGDRILQFMIVPVAAVTLKLVDSLDETERGTGGFGSTGN
jgi:dUTP pyrophosphatase